VIDQQNFGEPALYDRIFFVLKASVIVILLSIGVILGYLLFSSNEVAFENLGSVEMHQKIISQRDFAIQKAKAEGNYKCCIEPPCTMCYSEANQWNNQTAGTCACDDLIAQGKEPCPQCKRGLCNSSEGEDENESVCKVEI
jgi:hypothetical protein